MMLESEIKKLKSELGFLRELEKNHALAMRRLRKLIKEIDERVNG